MGIKEIKEAVQYPFAGFGGKFDMRIRHYLTLKDLATNYLRLSEMEGVPKEIVVPQKEWNNMTEAQQDYVKARNLARQECVLYFTKQLAGLEGIVNKSLDQIGLELKVWKEDYFGSKLEQELVKRFSQSIYENILGEK